MINAEKYKDEILIKSKEYVGYNYPLFKAIDSIKGVYMSFNETIGWLLSEYEPPLLENGDDLISGQYIEVLNTNTGEWCCRKYITYCDGLFWCIDEDTSLTHKVALGWEHARLPEEGE